MTEKLFTGTLHKNQNKTKTKRAGVCLAWLEKKNPETDSLAMGLKFKRQDSLIGHSLIQRVQRNFVVIFFFLFFLILILLH